MTNLIEQGIKSRLRFAFRGSLSVEDVYQLPLIDPARNKKNVDPATFMDLEALALSLHNQIQETSAISFVAKKTVEADLLTLRFDIVKHIIEVKLAEEAAAKASADKNAKKQVLLGLLEQKKTEQMGTLTIEQIQAQLAEL